MVSPPALTIIDGHIQDRDTGLWVPRSYSNRFHHLSVVSEIINRNQSPINPTGYNMGVSLPRDKDTMVVKWAQHGSGWEDLIAASIVDGNIANIGVSPVIAPKISALVARQSDQAATASLELRGRTTPTRRARVAISRFNDSPMGATQAVRQMIYQLRVFNRGAPIATIPVMLNFDQWEENGLIPIPIDPDEPDPLRFYLEVDWKKQQPIPYLPSVFDLELTGNKEWPYWYRAVEGAARGGDRWVLLHKSHILPVIPSVSRKYGLGMSAVHQCLGFLAERILIDDERLEAMINVISDGILAVSGAYMSATKLKEEMKQQRADDRADGLILNRGLTVLTAMSKISMDLLRFRERDTRDPEKREQSEDRMIANAFGVPLSAIAVYGGVGYGAQSDTADDNNADAGVNALLHYIAVSLGRIYPTVQVSFNRPNNKAQRLKIEAFQNFSKGVSQLPDGTLSAAEVRAIIDRDLLDIPNVSAGDTSTTATNEDNNSELDSDDSESADTGEADELRVTTHHLLTGLQTFEMIVPEGANDPIPEGEADPEVVTPDLWDAAMDGYGQMLDAEVVEGDEVPEGQDFDRPWLWLSTGFLYHRLADQVEVDAEGRVALRDEFADSQLPASDTLVSDLVTGAITIQVWVAGMQRLTQNLYTNEWRMGRGGQNAMARRDYARLKPILDSEFRGIEDLGARISEGRYSEFQIRNFAHHQVKGATSAYEQGHASAHGLELPAYPGDGSQICQKGCRCHWRIEREDGVMVAYWELDAAAVHCATCLGNNAAWYPFR